MDSPPSRSPSQAIAGRGRQAGPAVEPGDLSLSFLTSLAEVDAIALEWGALERDARQPALFQSAAWCRVLVERLLAARDRHRPWIVTLRQRDRLVALAPLSLTRIGPVRLASALGEPLAQYGDILVSPDAPWAADALVDRLREGRRVDHLRLRRVRGDAAFASALDGGGADAVHPNLARHCDLGAHRDVEALTASIDNKAARDRQRLDRKLRASGQVEIVQLGPGRQAAEATELAVAWKRSWLASRNIASALFIRRRWLAMISALVADPSVGSQTSVVLLDGEPAAIEVGFRHNDRHYAFLGASRPGLERLSPNKAAMTAALAHCIASGVRTYDLLGPDEPYKRHWCPETTATHDRVMSFSALGALYGTIDRAGQRGLAMLLGRGPAAARPDRACR